MIKQFGSLNNGDKFSINNAEYEKIEAVRVSCCKTINAKLVADNNQTIFIQPGTEVIVND